MLLATCCYGLATNLAAPLQARYGSRAAHGPHARPRHHLDPPVRRWSASPTPTSSCVPLAAVVVLGIVGTGVAYLLMGTLVGRVGPTRASFITYLIPVVSLVLGVAFKDDHVAALALGGVALVIVGAVLASRQERT